jgi:hypothetical protein
VPIDHQVRIDEKEQMTLAGGRPPADVQFIESSPETPKKAHKLHSAAKLTAYRRF